MIVFKNLNFCLSTHIFFRGEGGGGLEDGYALVPLQIETDFCEWSLNLNICWKHTVNSFKFVLFLTTDF